MKKQKVRRIVLGEGQVNTTDDDSFVVPYRSWCGFIPSRYRKKYWNNARLVIEVLPPAKKRKASRSNE